MAMKVLGIWLGSGCVSIRKMEFIEKEKIRWNSTSLFNFSGWQDIINPDKVIFSDLLDLVDHQGVVHSKYRAVMCYTDPKTLRPYEGEEDAQLKQEIEMLRRQNHTYLGIIKSLSQQLTHTEKNDSILKLAAENKEMLNKVSYNPNSFGSMFNTGFNMPPKF